VVVAEFRVDVVSPIGETVSFEAVPDDLVTTPSTLVVFWLLLSEETDGDGATGTVVDWVVVELEDELCAKAAPVIRERATVAANRFLIILNSPGKLSMGGDRSLPGVGYLVPVMG